VKEELQEFNINLEDIEENIYLFNNINEAIEKMKKTTLKDRFEVVLNNNLIEAKDKYTGFRTILGCRITYDNLDKNISFVVKEDNEPTYEELQDRIDEAIDYSQKEIERLNNIINTMLDFNFFKEECPLNFGYIEKCDEEKAQDVFYEDDYCEENCNDDYKKCWLKYFEKLQELKGSDKE
jgi:hypothetical protein